MSDETKVSYVLQVHAPDGEVVRTIARETPEALASAAHEIMARGALEELGDQADLYTGTDEIDYAEMEFSILRIEQHRLNEAEKDELEAEIHRLGPDTLLSKRRRSRGFE